VVIEYLGAVAAVFAGETGGAGLAARLKALESVWVVVVARMLAQTLQVLGANYSQAKVNIISWVIVLSSL
jgi:hypothetical protein